MAKLLLPAIIGSSYAEVGPLRNIYLSASASRADMESRLLYEYDLVGLKNRGLAVPSKADVPAFTSRRLRLLLLLSLPPLLPIPLPLSQYATIRSSG
jgi:hypothetical protein